MIQSLRERIEGTRPVVSWGTPAHDLIDKADVIRIIAEHEREQTAVAIGVRPMLPPQIIEPTARGYERVNRCANDIGCHAGTDGDCYWSECPQIKDGEPRKSGRSCPLWNPSEDS